MKKYVIAIISIFCIIMLTTCFTYKSNAVGLEALDNPEEYTQGGEDSSEAINIANIIVWVIKTFGESIAVVVLVVIGIKYIFASADERAEYKQTMLPYIVGAVLIFSGAALTNILYEAFK